MILYQHQCDEAITWRKTPGDEDSDWWSGVQKVGATVALAAALALTGAQTAQAIQVSHLPQDEVIHVAEEDCWQNPVRPAIPANYVARPFLDTDEIVSQPVVAIEDEDYWQNPFVPLQATLWQSLPYNFDAAELVSTFDEDYWQNQFAPLAQKNAPQPFSDPNDFIGYTLDEDYLLSIVPRFQTGNFVVQQFDSADIFQQPVVFVPDEDYWQNSATPVLAKNILPASWDAFEGVQSVTPAPTGAHYIPSFRRRRR